MIQLFLKGGPVRWPLLLASIIALTVVIERVIFTVRESLRRSPEVVARIFECIEHGDLPAACQAARDARGFVARVLGYALEHREVSLSNALLEAPASISSASTAASPNSSWRPTATFWSMPVSATRCPSGARR